MVGGGTSGQLVVDRHDTRVPVRRAPGMVSVLRGGEAIMTNHVGALLRLIENGAAARYHEGEVTYDSRRGGRSNSRGRGN